MHVFAHSCTLITLIISVCLCFFSAYIAWTGRNEQWTGWLEKGQLISTGLMTLGSLILLLAFIRQDFSFKYVADYSDSFLPLFYAVTAFWGGQAGSFLLWAWLAALFTAIFIFTAGYRELRGETKAFFWIFYFSVQAFFLLIITGPSNPFLKLAVPPQDGHGLNPLLQNPGMIFHPPLLFLGYAGFTVPCCLAFASWVTSEPRPWLRAGRTWTLVSWTFLTAGIVLGAWWSYMELGWGGYWAWDPVENASLIPWLSATALLHTAVVQTRKKALHKTNVFLIGLTLLLCFFGTYLVRSGVIDSLHAFGGAGVGTPLFFFLISGLAITVVITFTGRAKEPRSLRTLISRQGLLVVAAWLFLALGAVVFLGTMWPLISKIWSQNPIGLKPDFYNRVCLPIFALASVLLVFCPWLGWKQGIRNLKTFRVVAASIIPAAAFLFWAGVRDPLPLVAAVSAVVCILGIAALFFAEPGLRRMKTAWAAYGVHVGLALVVLGVAFSGPYQVSKEMILKKGESVVLEKYTFTYEEFREHSDPAMAIAEAKLRVEKDGRPLGTLLPQRRMYRNFPDPFAEVSVIPGFGDELYATLLGFSRDHSSVTLKITINPLVNWIWIGGTLMSLFPFLGLGRRKV